MFCCKNPTLPALVVPHAAIFPSLCNVEFELDFGLDTDKNFDNKREKANPSVKPHPTSIKAFSAPPFFVSMAWWIVGKVSVERGADQIGCRKKKKRNPAFIK